VAKKRIKMLTAMAASSWSLSPGQITEVNAEIAKAWEAAGIAKLVEDEVETATIEPKETATKRRRRKG
jgi:hypothetical protein